MSEIVRARDLAVGDLLPGGETVVALHHDERAGSVSLVDDDGRHATMRADARLVVVARDPGGAPVERPPEPPLSPRERFTARRRLDAQAER